MKTVGSPYKVFIGGTSEDRCRTTKARRRDYASWEGWFQQYEHHRHQRSALRRSIGDNQAQ